MIARRWLESRWSALLRAFTPTLMTLYPPYLGAGVVVRRSATGRGYDVQMRLRAFNRNIVGTHFGGSLYSMADPFFMAILMERLGPDYIVWDKAAEIRFKRPGRGTVRCLFEVDDATVAAIADAAAAGDPVERWFEAQIKEDDAVVAEVRKLVYVRRKPLKG